MKRKVTSKVVSGGRVIGYYLDTDNTTLYTGETIRYMMAKGELEHYSDHELYIVERGEVDPDLDRSMVSTCHMLKKFAGSGNVVVDKTVHRTTFNTHLFSYLEYCGKDVDEFVREYLYNLQPFMLQRLSSQEVTEGLFCVVDTLYAVDMYIKIDTADKSKHLVVSFHESNKGGIAKSNRRNHKHDERVAVIPDTAKPVGDNGEYDVTFWVTRGLAFYKIQARGRKLTDCYSVRYSDISLSILNSVNDTLFQIIASDVPDELGFTDIRELTMTSFADDEISAISMLIDAILSTSDNHRKKYFTGALAGYVDTLPITGTEAQRIEDTLCERYRVRDSKALPGLLTMVTNGLHVASERNLSKRYVALVEAMPPGALSGMSQEEAISKFGDLIDT